MQKTTAIRALVMDWGSVLTLHDFDDFLREVAEEYGIDLLELKDIEGSTRKQMDLGEISDDEYMDVLNDHFRITIDKDSFREDFTKKTKVNGELISLLKELKGRYTLIILSNNNPFNVRFMRQETGFEDLFDHIFISCFEKLAKPDPEFYNLVHSIAGIPLTQCIFVDDNPVYLDAGKELGMHGILYEDFDTTKDKIEALIGKI